MIRFALVLLLAIPQDPHGAAKDRAAMAMGFDQNTTAHHFLLHQDGGAIDIVVKDAADTKNREAIRSHLSHIAMMFGSGDFDAPMAVSSRSATSDAPRTRHRTRPRFG